MHHPIVFEPAKVGNNEIEVWILPCQHFNRCQASYHIDNKGNPVAPRHFTYLAPGKRVETVNLQAAEAVVFDRSTNHQFDAPGIAHRMNRGETDQLARILTHNACQPSICGRIVAIEDGKNDRFIDTCRPRPFEMGLNARFGVPGPVKAIAGPGMAVAIYNHRLHSSRKWMIVSMPRKKLGKLIFSLVACISSSGSPKPRRMTGTANLFCSFATRGMVPPL